MQSTLATAVFLPIALAVIMFGLGLSLQAVDFTRVLRFPKAVLIGLAVQVLLLPLVCLLIAQAFGLTPALAVGMMLLAASPGGAVANLFSHLAHGDVALNITLTAVNSVLSIVTLPIIVGLSMQHLMGHETAIPLQFTKVIQVFALVLGPVAIGMLVNARSKRAAEMLRRPMKWLSVAFLASVIAVAASQDSGNIGSFVQAVGPACLAFNLASLGFGYAVPRLLKLERPQAIAIGMEVGIHNSTLAITVAMSPMMLDNPEMAIPAAVYGVMMLFTAAGFGWLVNRTGGRSVAPSLANGD